MHPNIARYSYEPSSPCQYCMHTEMTKKGDSYGAKNWRHICSHKNQEELAWVPPRILVGLPIVICRLIAVKASATGCFSVLISQNNPKL